MKNPILCPLKICYKKCVFSFWNLFQKNKERILQENNGYTLLDAGVKLISKWENLNECEKQKFRISAKELNSELIFEFK